jgi:hypothetical protein
VNGQESWEKMSKIDTYSSNLYSLSITDTGTQIFKHRKLTNNFETGTDYLKDSDVTSFGKALAMSIDG